MKKSLLCFILTAVFFCACSSEKADFKKGLAFLATPGKAASAMQVFSALLKEHPTDTMIILARAQAFERMADEDPKRKEEYLSMAENDYFNAVSINPRNPDILNNFGAYYIKQGLYLNALVYIDEALRYRPTFSMAHVNRGIVNFRLNNGSQALQDFNLALDYDYMNLLAHYNRALIYAEWKAWPPAIDDMTFVINQDPQNARALVERGKIFQAAGFYTQALEDFRQATIVNPSYALAFYHYGEMLFKKGEYEAALSAVMTSKELHNTYAPAYDLMGDMLAVEDPVAAAANYVIARNLDPDNARLYTDKMRKMLTSLGRKEVVENRFI